MNFFKYTAWAVGNVFVYAAVLVSGFGLLVSHQKFAVMTHVHYMSKLTSLASAWDIEKYI